MKTRLSIICAALFVAVLWTPNPRAEGPQTSGAAPKQDSRGDNSRGQNQQRSERFFWWKDAEVMKELGLSTQLSKRIDELFHKRLPQASTQWSELRKQEKELDRLIRERKVGADVISVQLDRVEAQRTMVNKSRTLMYYEMYQLLSADQYAKLVAYNERRRTGRGNSFR